MFFFFLFASHFGFFEFIMSKCLPKNKMVLRYNMNCLVFVLYWIEYKSKKDLKVIAYLHFKQCPNFFLNRGCILYLSKLRNTPLFDPVCLFLQGKYFSIDLDPSFFLTQPIIFGDFIKVRFSCWKCLLSSENIWFAINTEYLTTFTCRWVQRKLTVCMRIWQTWMRFRLFSSTTSMITTWPTPRRQSWFSSRMP